MVKTSCASGAKGICRYPWSKSSFPKQFAPNNSRMSSWFGITPGDFSTCEFTPWESLTKRKASLFGTAMAGLAHTPWMFRTIKPNATKAAMHGAHHPVFTGSYRRGLAFTTCACGFR